MISEVVQHWWSLTVSLAVGISLAVVFTFAQTPLYAASTSVFLTTDNRGEISELSPGAIFTEIQLESYLEVATHPGVLEPVLDRLGFQGSLDDFTEQLSLGSPTDTSIIQVSFSSPDPQFASRAANEVASQIVSVVATLSPIGPNGQQMSSAQVLSPADVASSPSSPSMRNNVVLGSLLGLLIGVAQLFLRRELNVKLKSASAVESATGAATLVAITPEDERVASGRWNGLAQPVESFRRLAASLRFVTRDAQGPLLVSSLERTHAASEVTFHLGLALSEAGTTVVVVDADLRSQFLSRLVGCHDDLGLSELLTGQAELEDCIVNVGVRNLSVLPSGAIPPNASLLLGASGFTELLDMLAESHDVVIVSGVGIDEGADALELAGQLQETLLVSHLGSSSRSRLAGATEKLEGVRCRIIGNVLFTGHRPTLVRI